MSPTIKDVAKRAKVSLATVSFVINKKKNLSPETVRKVQHAIDELNYHPRRSARGLASKKSGNLGFILTDDHFSRAEPFYTKIFLGTEFEARQHNYYILLTTVEQNFTKKSIPRFLLEKNVDGVILAGHVPDKLVEFIHRNYKIPVVLIDFLSPRARTLAVLIDNIDGAMQATTHCIDQGHRNIAFIGGEMSHPSMQERFIGYKRSLNQAGLPVQEKLIVTDAPGTGNQDGFNATEILRNRGGQFTAIFCANDAMAYGAIRYLHKQNLHVPHDVAIVGFDDVDMACQMEPQLTTIRVNKEDMGAIAVRQMVEMIHDQNKNMGKILVPVELIVRQSS